MNRQYIALAAIAGASVLGLGATAASAAADQAKEPSYACSIKVADKTKDADLAGLAKIRAAQAQTAANAALPGTASKAKLENENGCVVYSVVIQGADGKLHDVKVDAGTGHVVHQELTTSNDADNETNDANGEQESGSEK